MIYDINKKDVVVRLEKEEVELFRDNSNFKNFIVDEIADTLICVYNSNNTELTTKEIIAIELELNRLEDILEEELEALLV